jgi:hypothetical protein
MRNGGGEGVKEEDHGVRRMANTSDLVLRGLLHALSVPRWGPDNESQACTHVSAIALRRSEPHTNSAPDVPSLGVRAASA